MSDGTTSPIGRKDSWSKCQISKKIPEPQSSTHSILSSSIYWLPHGPYVGELLTTKAETMTRKKFEKDTQEC